MPVIVTKIRQQF